MLRQIENDIWFWHFLTMTKATHWLLCKLAHAQVHYLKGHQLNFITNQNVGEPNWKLHWHGSQKLHQHHHYSLGHPLFRKRSRMDFIMGDMLRLYMWRSPKKNSEFYLYFLPLARHMSPIMKSIRDILRNKGHPNHHAAFVGASMYDPCPRSVKQL